MLKILNLPAKYLRENYRYVNADDALSADAD